MSGAPDASSDPLWRTRPDVSKIASRLGASDVRRADAALRAEIINAVEHLDEISIAELAGLLGAVNPTRNAREHGGGYEHAVIGG